MRRRWLLAAAPLLLASAGLAQSGAAGLRAAGLVAEGGGRTWRIDFNGDGRPETVLVARVADPRGTALFDNPWARSVGAAAGGRGARGERVLAVIGLGPRIRALRNAVYDSTVPLIRGRSPGGYGPCWRNRRRDAIYVGNDAGGVISWDGRRFNWYQCGD